jgi:tRNA pseudouridine38-40 synthase
VATIRLLIAYDGTGFRGWAAQREPHVRTVQRELESVIERVLGEPPRLTVAGRTDAGVHARGQVASFRTDSPVAPEQLRSAVNGALGPEIVVREAELAADGFDARFDATAREYRYVIDTAEVPDPFTARFRWHRPGTLSVPKMRAAARQLVGEHDFSSFCRQPGGARSTVRHLRTLRVVRDGEVVTITARADSFLHQMVRSLTGTLVSAGAGKVEPSDVASILAARDRAAAPQLAPARGLTLERVIYGRRSGSLTELRSRR